jgi:hypothetical protein
LASAVHGWRAPADLHSTNTDDPQLAVDARGNTRPVGGAWHRLIGLSTAGRNAFNPQAAVDARGIAVVVLADLNGTSYNVGCAENHGD